MKGKLIILFSCLSLVFVFNYYYSLNYFKGNGASHVSIHNSKDFLDLSKKANREISRQVKDDGLIPNTVNQGLADDAHFDASSVNETNPSMYLKESSNLMRFRNISCEPLYPEVLLYNRIFKTGSTTLTFYILNVASESNITVKSGTTEDWYNTGDPHPYPDHIEKYAAKKEKLVYTAHFFFRPRMKIKRDYTYINIFREPVQRVVSHYHYMRNEKLRSKDRILELKASGQWNETLVECIEKQHRGCEDNVMTRFLCGTHSYCKTGSNKALERAKSNLKRYYSCVGTLKNISLFIKVLRKRLPSFFKRPHQRKSLMKEKLNKRKSSVDEEILQVIRDRNQADIKLYELVRSLEQQQIRACGLQQK